MSKKLPVSIVKKVELPDLATIILLSPPIAVKIVDPVTRKLLPVKIKLADAEAAFAAQTAQATGENLGELDGTVVAKKKGPYGTYVQWGTVRLTFEPTFEPPVRFRAAARQAGYADEHAITMAIGETQALR